MKIGILSDTHKRVQRTQRVIDLLLENGVDHLLHAGDIVREETLQMMEDAPVDYTAVFGNNDKHLLPLENRYNLHKEPYNFTLESLDLVMMHHPLYVTSKPDIAVYGHTHTFVAKMQKNTLVINPGEACGRNKPLSECALLEIKKKSYSVTYFYRAVGTDTWTTKEFKFERNQ